MTLLQLIEKELKKDRSDLYPSAIARGLCVSADQYSKWKVRNNFPLRLLPALCVVTDISGAAMMDVVDEVFPSSYNKN